MVFQNILKPLLHLFCSYCHSDAEWEAVSRCLLELKKEVQTQVCIVTELSRTLIHYVTASSLTHCPPSHCLLSFPQQELGVNLADSVAIPSPSPRRDSPAPSAGGSGGGGGKFSQGGRRQRGGRGTRRSGSGAGDDHSSSNGGSQGSKPAKSSAERASTATVRNTNRMMSRRLRIRLFLRAACSRKSIAAHCTVRNRRRLSR